MANAHSSTHPLAALEARAIGVGALAGLVAGVGMGLVLQVGTDLLPLLGAVAGETTLLRGWLVHLGVSALYGILFAVILAYPPVESFLDTFGFREYVLVGIIYGVSVAAVSIGLLPFVFDLPWAPRPTPSASGTVPASTVGGLVPAAMFGLGHLVYGAIAGAVYAWLGPTAD